MMPGLRISKTTSEQDDGVGSLRDLATLIGIDLDEAFTQKADRNRQHSGGPPGGSARLGRP